MSPNINRSHGRGHFRETVLLVLVFLLGATSLAAQTRRLADPKDPHILLAQRFVEARNTVDSAQRLLLLAGIMAGREFPKHGTNGFLGDLLAAGGPFEPTAFYSVGGRAAIHIIGREVKTGSWMRYQLGVVAGEPDRIGLIAQSESRRPAQLPQGGISTSKGVAFLRQYVEDLASEAGFSGAVLVAQDDKPLLELYLGRANDSTGESVTEHTALSMASGSKMFTSVLIGQLVDEGLLDWGDPIGKHVPLLAAAPWAGRVTVRQLLTHSSGLPEYWDDRFERNAASIVELREILPYFVGKELDFSPGQKSQYSNTNFIVLGLVVEAVRKKDYSEVVGERILRPLRMTSTSVRRTQGAAMSYEPTMPGAWSPVALDLPPSSAGGGTSTAQDLLKFVTALRSGRLVEPERLREMTTEQVRLSGATRYGLGFEVAGPDRAWWGHGGLGPGVKFDLRAYPATGVTLILMSNRDGAGFLDLLLVVDELLAGSSSSGGDI